VRVSGPDLFAGEHIRLAPVDAACRAEMARWTEQAEYLRNVDTDIAFPRAVPGTGHIPPGDGSTTFEFAIRTLSGNEFVGFVALHSIEWNNRAAMLAIGIGDPARRRLGYGTEAVQLVLRYAFDELNLNRVGLDVVEYNTAALGLYQKAGFRREGALRSAVLRDGRQFDRIIMGILRAEWTQQEAEDDKADKAD